MRRRLKCSDRGSVLLETAIAVPVLLAVSAALVWVTSLGASYVRALDVAQAVARQAARGVSPQALDAMAQGHAIEVSSSNGLVTVTASRVSTSPLPVLGGLGIDISAQATALAEWGVTP